MLQMTAIARSLAALVLCIAVWAEHQIRLSDVDRSGSPSDPPAVGSVKTRSTGWHHPRLALAAPPTKPS